MTIDISTLSSVQSLLTQNTKGATPATSTNFTDYLMDALDASKSTTITQDTNGLYDLISNNSSSSVMQNLLATDSSNMLSQFLQGDSSTVNGLTGLSSDNNSTSNATVATNMFSDYLQSSMQSSIQKSMTAAKMKLQTNLDEYIAANGGVTSEAVKMRIAQMQQNVTLVDNFLQTRVSSDSATTASSTNNQLMELLSSNSAYSKFLLTNQS